MTERPAPAVNGFTEPFWSGGAAGELRIQHCDACGRWQHPPKPMCSRCHSRDLAARPTSGRGTLWSFTISRMAWGGLEAPYVVADVELDEQPGLHLLTTVVGVDLDAVEVGMPVVVDFEPAGETWIPVFRPAELA